MKLKYRKIGRGTSGLSRFYKLGNTFPKLGKNSHSDDAPEESAVAAAEAAGTISVLGAVLSAGSVLPALKESIRICAAAQHRVKLEQA